MAVFINYPKLKRKWTCSSTTSFRTVFKREYVKEQEQQDALDLKGGKVTLKSVEKK
jgi:hypothetical protein